MNYKECWWFVSNTFTLMGLGSNLIPCSFAAGKNRTFLQPRVKEARASFGWISKDIKEAKMKSWHVEWECDSGWNVSGGPVMAPGSTQRPQKKTEEQP
jgi:hypothetical protein